MRERPKTQRTGRIGGDEIERDERRHGVSGQRGDDRRVLRITLPVRAVPGHEAAHERDDPLAPDRAACRRRNSGLAVQRVTEQQRRLLGGRARRER